MKQFEVLEWASLFLQQHNRERNVAEILLQHFLGVDRSKFYTMMRETVPEHILQSFQQAIQEHAETGIPVQHIIGYEMFYGRKFAVNEQVLIPRPETEELVDYVIQNIQHDTSKETKTIVDIGTGSGVIAITLALQLQNVRVYGTDISAEALRVAKQNGKQLEATIQFRQGDFLKPLMDEGIKVDWVISNPPYIAWEEEMTLQDTVKNFDPSLALFAKENGLYAYQQIIRDLPHVLNHGGKVAFEIGETQGEAVQSLLKQTLSTSTITIKQDINQKDRMVIAHLP